MPILPTTKVNILAKRLDDLAAEITRLQEEIKRLKEQIRGAPWRESEKGDTGNR